MINLAHIPNAAGIGPTGNAPAAGEPDQRPHGAGVGGAGFFGALFALFASRQATDLPVIPSGAAPWSSSYSAMPVPTRSPEGAPVSAWDGIVTHGDVIANAGARAFEVGVADPAAPPSREGLAGGVEPVVPGIETSSASAVSGTVPQDAYPSHARPAGKVPAFTQYSRVTAPNATGNMEPLISTVESSSAGAKDGHGLCGGGPVDRGQADTSLTFNYHSRGMAPGATGGGLPGHAGQTAVGREITVAEGGDRVPSGSAHVRELGMQPQPLQDYVDWAIDLHLFGRNAASGIPVQGAHSASADTRNAGDESPDALADERPPTHNLQTQPELTAPTRYTDFLAGRLFRAGGGEQVFQNRAPEALARNATDGPAMRPAPLGDNGGRVMTLLQGQVDVTTEQSNAAPTPDTRGQAVLSSITKTAFVSRVEPVVTPEDVERAFIFTSPQETVLSDGENAPPGEAWARTVVSRVCDEALYARAAGRTSLSFEITTASGEIVRVRIAMTSNVVSGRIGVMNAETREVLALHIPQLSQRLEMENLVPERFDVYLMNSDGEGERRGGQHKSRWAAHESDEPATEDNLVYFASEPRTFEKWA